MDSHTSSIAIEFEKIANHAGWDKPDLWRNFRKVLEALPDKPVRIARSISESDLSAVLMNL